MTEPRRSYAAAAAANLKPIPNTHTDYTPSVVTTAPAAPVAPVVTPETLLAAVPPVAAARVYYDSRWIDGTALPRYLTAVPAHRVRGGCGAAMVLQDGRSVVDGGPDTDGLLTPDERIRARKKVIATWDIATAMGGARSRVDLAVPRFVVTLYAGTCQMDHTQLEPRLFVLAATDTRVTDELRRAAEKGRSATVLPIGRHALAPTPTFTYASAPTPAHAGDITSSAGEEACDTATATTATTATELDTKADAETKAEIKAEIPANTPTHYFDAGAYRACIAEDLSLILCAFENEVASVNAVDAALAAQLGVPFIARAGYLKLPAMGLSHGIALADGTLVGPLMFAPFLAALRDVLCSRPAWPWLAAVELPDYTGNGAFTPRYAPTMPVTLVTGWRGRRDVLAFTDDEAAAYVCGVVSPGSAFTLPGNGPTPGCLESVIAANTTQRAHAWYTHNPALLHAATHVAVHTGFTGQVRWWPPTEWRRRARGTGSSK